MIDTFTIERLLVTFLPLCYIYSQRQGPHKNKVDPSFWGSNFMWTVTVRHSLFSVSVVGTSPSLVSMSGFRPVEVCNPYTGTYSLSWRHTEITKKEKSRKDHIQRRLQIYLTVYIARMMWWTVCHSGDIIYNKNILSPPLYLMVYDWSCPVEDNEKRNFQKEKRYLTKTLGLEVYMVYGEVYVWRASVCASVLDGVKCPIHETYGRVGVDGWRRLRRRKHFGRVNKVHLNKLRGHKDFQKE